LKIYQTIYQNAIGNNDIACHLKQYSDILTLFTGQVTLIGQVALQYETFVARNRKLSISTLSVGSDA
jgi:hypothetical protein